MTSGIPASAAFLAVLGGAAIAVQNSIMIAVMDRGVAFTGALFINSTIGLVALAAIPVAVGTVLDWFCGASSAPGWTAGLSGNCPRVRRCRMGGMASARIASIAMGRRGKGAVVKSKRHFEQSVRRPRLLY